MEDTYEDRLRRWREDEPPFYSEHLDPEVAMKIWHEWYQKKPY